MRTNVYIDARHDDPRQPQRQQAYLRALETIPNLSIHYGSFLTKPRRLPLARPKPGWPRTVEVLRTEEKGSDVNLATFLLVDGFKKDYESAAVVSNDSDLTESIEAVRRELRLPVGVLMPGDAPRSALPADFYKRIRSGALAACLFPSSLGDRFGEIRKPARW